MRFYGRFSMYLLDLIGINYGIVREMDSIFLFLVERDGILIFQRDFDQL